MGNVGTPEILIIAGVLVLLFGATKLPQMARSLGQSARVFKAETRGLRKDEADAQPTGQTSEQSGSSQPRELGSGTGSSATTSSEQSQPRHDSTN